MTTTWTNTLLRAEIRERMGIASNDTTVTDAILTDLINAAQRQVSLEHDWPWLIEEDADFTATVANQRKYAVTVPADDWRKTLMIVVNDDQVLQVMQPQEIHRWASKTGQPIYYAISGTDIYLAPTPDSVYTVLHLYVKDPAVLSADGDTVAVEDWAIDLLIARASINVAMRLRDFELANMYRQEYMQILETMRDEVRRTRQLPRPRARIDVGWR